MKAKRRAHRLDDAQNKKERDHTMPRRVLSIAALVCIAFASLSSTAPAMEISPRTSAGAVLPLDRPAEKAVKLTSKLLDTVSETMVGSNGPFKWPVKGAVNTHFGDGHDGIDIEGETGDPIVATRAGEIVFAGDDGDGYGTKIIIDHGRGITSLYSHLNEMEKRRGWVDAGDRVGTVGCTGSCSGDHLHFEILRDEQPLNPLDFLP